MHTMTYEELTAVQALEIANLNNTISWLEADRRSIKLMIIGIGGPLNDNNLNFTPIQMKLFGAILEHAE